METLTLQQRKEICKTCTNRRVDYERGLLCDLTGEEPSFLESCPSYNQEEKPILNDQDYAANETPVELSPDALERLKTHQNFPLATIVGVVAAIVGAIIWAGITVATEYQIGFMAVGVGALVGYAVQIAGKGVENKFGFLGAGLALVGCLLGNLLTQLGFYAKFSEVSIFEIIGMVPISDYVSLITASFHPMDLLFYGIAVYEGYKFAFRRLTQNDLHDMHA